MDTATDFRELSDGEVFVGGGWKKASNLLIDKENTIWAFNLHDAADGQQPVILIWKGITVEGVVNLEYFSTAPDGYTNALTKALIHDQLIKADNAAHYRPTVDQGAKVVLPEPQGNGSVPQSEDGKGNKFAGDGDSRLSPEIRQWAMQQVNQEEIVAGLRELRANGGLELSEFVHELEQIAEARPK